MSDVSKIQGPGSPPEPGGKKEKQISDEFKKKMQKVEKISGADPEQKKKRKRREETEDEPDLERESNLPAPSKTFSLEEEPEKAKSIFDIPKNKPIAQGPADSPPPEKQKSTSRASFVSQTPPSEEEDQDELVLPPSQTPPSQSTTSTTPSGAASEDNVNISGPSAYESPAFEEDNPSDPQQQPHDDSINKQNKTWKAENKSEIGAKTTDSPETIKQKKKEEVILPGSPVYDLSKGKKGKKKELKKAEEVAGLTNQKQVIKKGPASPIQDEVSKTVKKSPETLPRKGKRPLSQGDEDKKRLFETVKEEKEKTKETEEFTGIFPPQIQIEAHGHAKDEKKGIKGSKEKIEKTSNQPLNEIPEGRAEALLPTSFPSETTPPSPTPPYAYLHPQVLELFERMVGVMTIATYNGATETTISLNSPQFASSVFYGAQIIIREYSTAPKVFNIELLGNEQAIELFQGNAEDLMAAFQSGNYTFRVNQLQTGLLRSEKPLFHRKEKPSRKNKGDNQGQ